MRQHIYDTWTLIMDSDRSPLKNIPDNNARHLILQILAWMWCIAFGLIVGSWYAVGVSLIGHFLLLGAVGITVATFETAKRKPQIFMNGLRGKGGEHE